MGTGEAPSQEYRLRLYDHDGRLLLETSVIGCEFEVDSGKPQLQVESWVFEEDLEAFQKIGKQQDWIFTAKWGVEMDPLPMTQYGKSEEAGG